MSLEYASDAQLARAIEENLFDLFRAICALPGAAKAEAEALSMHTAGYPAAMFNAAWRARFPASEIDARIDDVLAWFVEQDAPLVAWWFSQNTQPPGLYDRLIECGFELDYEAPGMVIDSATIRSPLLLPDGFRIVEAQDAQTLADWSEALLGAYVEYDMPEDSARTWEKATLALGVHNVPWRLYVGYLDDKPVATNMVLDAAGVAGLFCVGTIPDVRGKGIARPIILQPLLDSLGLGYRYGVLFASEMGIPVYEHLGFHRVGIDIGRYVLYGD